MNNKLFKIKDILYCTNEILGFNLNETDGNEVLDYLHFVMSDFYKIVLLESDYGYMATIKHSYPHPELENKKVRELITNQWIKSENRLVSDGSMKRDKNYISGWHLFNDYQTCLKYAKGFKIKNIAVIKVKAKGISVKTKDRVFLADEIFIDSHNDPIRL